MKIKLEALQHQTDALTAIGKAFPGMDTMSHDPDANYIYANPLINYRYNDKANIDIKMETGTGKIYAYTRMMYEMHQKGDFSARSGRCNSPAQLSEFVEVTL